MALFRASRQPAEKEITGTGIGEAIHIADHEYTAHELKQLREQRSVIEQGVSGSPRTVPGFAPDC